MIPLNTRVVLRSFNASPTAPRGCRPDENYWKLIGELGCVVETSNARQRVLVRFDKSVADHGLVCHNRMPNSLYILEADLRVVPNPPDLA
jgi:hypothetical protein